MSTTTSSINPYATSDLSNNGSNPTLGSATYYAAIGAAILVMIGVSFTSRILYIRRARAHLQRDRMELTRRGEEGGLPTYMQTTAPQTLSYIHSSSPYSLPNRRYTSQTSSYSSPVPPSHPAYTPPNLSRPSRTYHPGDTSAPPAYIAPIPEPPKYVIEDEDEDQEVVGGDREAEIGGRGQEIDAGSLSGLVSHSEIEERERDGIASGSGSTIELTGNDGVGLVGSRNNDTSNESTSRVESSLTGEVDPNSIITTEVNHNNNTHPL